MDGKLTRIWEETRGTEEVGSCSDVPWNVGTGVGAVRVTFRCSEASARTGVVETQYIASLR
jgi:hypothetical protein